MHKLPIASTYANVIRFAFGRFFTTLRLSWLPIVLLLAVIGAHFALQFSMISGHIGPGGAAVAAIKTPGFGIDIGLMVGMQAALFVLQLIAMSAVAVSIHRVILFGDTKPGVWFNFPFGATEVRFLTMGLLFGLMTVGVIALMVGPVLFLVTSGDVARFFANWPESLQELARGGGIAGLIIAYIVGWVTVLVLFVRLSVWPPSLVASGRLSPAEAWRLTRGNFWSLIGLFILVGATIYAMFIPVGIGVAVYMVTQIGDLPAQGRDVPPEKVFEMFRQALPFIAAFYFILIVFVTGVTVATVSYAYKALKGVDAKTPMTAEG
jgi:hypothetical protein